MKRPIVVAVLAATVFGSFVSMVGADLTAKRVREAIEKGVAFLKGQQRNDGTWPEWSFGPGLVSQPGGITALCTLALLNSGVEPDDPAIQRALAQLRKMPPKTTYVTALQTMVFCKAEPNKDLLLISRNVKWLESIQIPSGPTKGAWSYSSPSGGDNSNTQFALLALHEAERVGVKISGRTWQLAKDYWESCQNPDGSWGYQKRRGRPGSGSGSGSMTCAGIASLVITSDKVRQSNATAEGDRIRCCVKRGADGESIHNGLQWLARNFSVEGNPGSEQSWLLYYLYGVERVGRLTAQRFFVDPRRGPRDWYREGCERLVDMQDGLSGFWKHGRYVEKNELIATSLALLFLSKGRRPVLIAKLKHPPGDDWNQHRSDVDNLTRFVESRWRLDLTWQVVDLHAAEVEDLLQAPVLYFCGDKSPLPKTAGQQERVALKLRAYLGRGGFLFAEGYDAGTGFDKGFRDLMKKVFPEEEYQLHPLDKEHPIWHAEQKLDPNYPRQLEGIEFGCRTSVVYAPANSPQPQPSLSCLWELSRSGRGEKFSPKVRAQINAALGIGINVLAYATNREFLDKSAHFDRQTDRQPNGPVPRGQVSVAKLRHPGGCNAAPRALFHLMEMAGQKLNIRTAARTKLLDITDEAIFDYHLVFMHGRNSFTLTGTERKRLRTYIERGGMLLADSICASKAFTDSFRSEMKAIFPNRKLEDIPITDPILTRTYGGFDLKTVTRRDPQRRRPGEPLKAALRKVPPELEGIKFDDRWGVIFSQYDVSCALEKHDSLDCRGYVRRDAGRIGLNVILYSLQQ